jgi:hypothetical protein
MASTSSLGSRLMGVISENMIVVVLCWGSKSEMTERITQRKTRTICFVSLGARITLSRSQFISERQEVVC